MARNVRIEDIDRGWDGLIGIFTDLRDAGVEVGLFHEDGRHPGGKSNSGRIVKPSKLTIAAIGAIHEYGAPGRNIPERSFLRSTYAEHQAKFANEAAEVMRRVIDRQMTVDQAMQVLGATQATAVKRKINDFTTPPNAPATVKAKGKNDPLVDTRVMRDHVKFKKLRKRGG